MDGADSEQTWGPVTLAVARDRSEAGWMFTRVEHVRDALTERQLAAAVQEEGPTAAEDLILARIAVDTEGAVATLPDPAGPPVAGAHLTEVVGELAYSMRTTISVDGQVLVGPAGVPVKESPPGMSQVTEDRRMVYAWPGTDRYVAMSAAMAVKEPLTWHEADGWTVLASGYAPQRVLTGFRAAMERFPRVTLSRKGPERTVEYVAGNGADDLRLMAWWGPWLEPLGDLATVHRDSRTLLEMLAHPRGGQDEMEQHPDLTEEQRVAVGAAMAQRDGAAFLGQVSTALQIPEIAARLAEQAPGDDDPALAGEPVAPPGGRWALARSAFREMQHSPTQTPLQQRIMRVLNVIELVLAVFFLSAAVLDFLPGPWWVWLVLGVLLAADGLKDLVIDPWRKRRAATEAEDSTRS